MFQPFGEGLVAFCPALGSAAAQEEGQESEGVRQHGQSGSSKKLSQNGESMQPSEPQQSTGQLNQAQVVLPLFVVSNQDAPTLLQPGQSALNLPFTVPS
jgi:hypothetical protein